MDAAVLVGVFHRTGNQIPLRPETCMLPRVEKRFDLRFPM
jgi:hypothetical protein